MRSKSISIYAIPSWRCLLTGPERIKWIGMMRVRGDCVDQCFVCTRSSSSLESLWRFLVAATPPAAAASEAMASCCWWCSCPAPSSCCPGSPAAKAVIPGTAATAGAGLCWWGISWGTPTPATWGKLGPMELWWWWWPRGQTSEASNASISMIQIAGHSEK